MNATTTSQLSVDLELGDVSCGPLSHPDKMTLVFSSEIIKRIAVAQLGIQAMGFHHAEVIIDLPDDLPLFEGDEPWIQDERDAGAGDFEPSSAWLKIQQTSLAVEIWDKHGDAELHSTFNIDWVPGLPEAIRVARLEALGEVIGRLAI
ncbi:hypothetical protein [Rubrivivax gelatinosus]|uniref:hypothetical protein n=1 Tax=Rubrivivax gelatinosus TaxID=28068 RepID=UPI0005C24A67|nr:hypothetical protein [Rubrivivax gelatinosus]MBG6083087.1 hypothetical protein [Rubrivivax gelatinosus]